MSTTVAVREWWQVAEGRHDVEACLDKLNESQLETEAVSHFSVTLQGLNLLWNLKSRLDNERERSDSQGFRALLLAIPAARQEELCRSNGVQMLASFTPQILNQDCLRSSHAYVPGQPITPELRNQASREHRQLKEAIDSWNSLQSVEHRETVLKKFSALLYVVRSNIAHGEKTIHGPDLSKAQRDRQVCEICLPAVAALLEAIFEYPTRGLIAYGTLQPSEPNHSKLDGISNQQWSDCEVVGKLSDDNGLKTFEWRKAADRNAAKLLRSPDLPQHWAMLDEFEGNKYARTLATADVNGSFHVAMIYQKRR